MLPFRSVSVYCPAFRIFNQVTAANRIALQRSTTYLLPGIAQQRQDEAIDALTTEEELMAAAITASQSQYDDDLAKVLLDTVESILVLPLCP